MTKYESGFGDKQIEEALAAIEEEGMEIIELSEEEMARWIKAVGTDAG